MNELISIIMSIYDEKLEWVKKSVHSMLIQTYSNFEMIIIIDNPNLSEDVQTYLKQMDQKDTRIVLIYNEENIGLAMSLNKGIAIAKGKYIARMDADDISDCNRLKVEIEEIKRRNLDIIGTGKIDIDENDNALGQYKDCVEDDNTIKRILPYSSCIVHPSIMIKSNVLKDIGMYRNFKQSQDYDLWLRLLSSHYKFGNVNEPLLRYRVRIGSISGKHPYCQYMTSCYQIKMYKERKQKKVDSFTEDNFKIFMEKHKALNEINNYKYSRGVKYLDESFSLIKNKNFLKGMYHIIKAIIVSPYMIDVLKKRIIIFYMYKKGIRNAN